jgi:hypothetical protein
MLETWLSELASKKVVFEQPKEAMREGCRLSAPVNPVHALQLRSQVHRLGSGCRRNSDPFPGRLTSPNRVGTTSRHR